MAWLNARLWALFIYLHLLSLSGENCAQISRTKAESSTSELVQQREGEVQGSCPFLVQSCWMSGWELPPWGSARASGHSSCNRALSDTNAAWQSTADLHHNVHRNLKCTERISCPNFILNLKANFTTMRYWYKQPTFDGKQKCLTAECHAKLLPCRKGWD